MKTKLWIIIPISLLLMLIMTFASIFIPPDLHWRYSRDQIHHFLVWGEPNDTLRSAIEAWYITVENPETSSQMEIDSLESIIMDHSKYIWE